MNAEALHKYLMQKSNGITRTVICVDHIGPEAVVLSSEFDLQDRLLRQVRYEHLNGALSNSVFTEFSRDGHIAAQWVFLYDREGRVSDTYGFDEEGNPFEVAVKRPLAC